VDEEGTRHLKPTTQLHQHLQEQLYFTFYFISFHCNSSIFGDQEGEKLCIARRFLLVCYMPAPPIQRELQGILRYPEDETTIFLVLERITEKTDERKILHHLGVLIVRFVSRWLDGFPVIFFFLLFVRSSCRRRREEAESEQLRI